MRRTRRKNRVLRFPLEPDLPFQVALARSPAQERLASSRIAESPREATWQLDALLRRLQVEVVQMSAEGAVLARSAYRRFGEGVGSPAVLNYGDCLTYGVAAALGQPLLFKGNDFGRTDIAAVSY